MKHNKHLLFLPLAIGLSFQLSPAEAAPIVDPLAHIDFIARWQTESNVIKASTARTHLPSGLYKDVACTQPATAVGDVVAAVRDEFNRNGLVLTQGDITKCPTLQFVSGRPVLRFDGDDFYAIPASVPLDNLDLWVRYKINVAPNNPYPAVVSGQAGDGMDFTDNGFNLLVQRWKGSTAQNVMHVSHLHNGDGASTIFVEGVPVTSDKMFNGTSTQLCVGGRITPTPSGSIAMDLDALLIGTAIPPTDYALIDKYLGANPEAPRLVCVGDSITDGTAGTEGGMYATQEYPSQLQLMRPNQFVINSGMWGARIEGMLPVDQQFSPGAQLVVFIGSNNLASNNLEDTADAAYARLVAYCKERRAVGWKVYVGTILPRAHGTTPQSNVEFEAKRQAFNATVRATHATFADGLVDFAADKRIGEPGDELDTTYFTPDKVHPSVAGAKVLAEVVNASLPIP